MKAAVEPVSVRDIVRRRMGADPDVWRLALVQRALVWDHVRMRYLLDSLLARYPIGSLLVCRLEGSSHVMRFDDRKPVETSDAAWQLLDGQQRVNALYSIFTSGADYGRFYLLMTEPRPDSAGPVTGRRGRDQAVKYIHWLDGKEAGAAVPARERRIDLGRWYVWAEDDSGERIKRAQTMLDGSNRHVVALLNELDPDFIDSLDDAQTAHAGEFLRLLIDVWLLPSIPVQYLPLRSTADLLEVFTRVNRAGVQVAGEDLFFAAVKTEWPKAEQTVADVENRLTPAPEGEVRKDSLISRMGALRLAGRLAARAVRQSDLVPPAIDRLSGRSGKSLVAALEAVLAPDSAPVRRMATLVNLLTSSASGLGFGLYSVHDRLWDDVLGWAAVNRNIDEPGWLARNLHPIDSYLLGATAFRYPTIFGDRYSRLAMKQALRAGVEGRPFPLTDIIEVTHGTIRSLQSEGQRVHGLEGDDVVRLADANTALFLSVVQRIPYAPQRDRFDWDHIYAQAQARRMWSPGPHGRKRHHRFRRFVGSAGNLWGLDAGLNRQLGAGMPSAKFETIDALRKQRDPRIWDDDRWWLSQLEIAEFKRVGIDLETADDAAVVDAAMVRFHNLVTTRARRIVDAVFTRYPDAGLFASGAGVPARSATEDDADIAGALGVAISALPDRPPEPASAPAPTADVDRRQRDEHANLVDLATRRLTHGRLPPMGTEPGVEPYRRRYICRPLGAEHPCLSVGVRESFRGYRTPVWLRFHRNTPLFDVIRSRIAASRLSQRIVENSGHLWMPLDVPGQAGEDAAVNSLAAQIEEVISIAYHPLP